MELIYLAALFIVLCVGNILLDAIGHFMEWMDSLTFSDLARPFQKFFGRSV